MTPTGMGMLLVVGMAIAGGAQGRLETVTVAAAGGERTVPLPGELRPFEAVDVVARVAGYVERLDVDRGSDVRRGQVLATLSAPELAAQVAEADARVAAAEADRVAAGADLAAARVTFERMSAANATPGAIAAVELRHAEEAMKAAVSRQEAAGRAVDAARAVRESAQSLVAYLRVTAPFAGRVTERFVHPGALVGPASGALVRLEQTTRLRLVLPVPEHLAGQVTRRRELQFRVPAHPGRTFTGTLARASGSLDVRTRTLAVELDVANPDGALAPGMYPEVTWPVGAADGAVLVPVSAVVSTTERTFVVRVRGGRAEWVTVRRLATRGDQVEVTGSLAVGDVILRRGTDEVREGQVIP